MIVHSRMGVLVSPNNKRPNPGLGVLLTSLCTWILISAMSAHVYADENQTLTNVTTQTSLGILSEKADYEVNTSITTNITNTNTKEVNNHPDTANSNTTTKNTTLDSSSLNINESVNNFNIESNPNTDTTNTNDGSSSQSDISIKTTPDLLSETLPNGVETTAQQSEVDTNNTPTETATEDWFNSRSVTWNASEVTNNTDLSTVRHQNTSEILDVDNCTKASCLGTLGFIVVVCVAVAAVIVIIVMIAVIIYFSKGRCRKQKRHIEEEYVDCDHELYTSLNIRHHGARAEYQPLNLKDEGLITKMEVDETEDVNHTVVDVDDPADTGRYLSPEGLVYVTIAHERGNGQTKAYNKIQKDDDAVQYASVDINKTNKLFLKLQKRERGKERQRVRRKQRRKRHGKI